MKNLNWLAVLALGFLVPGIGFAETIIWEKDFVKAVSGKRGGCGGFPESGSVSDGRAIALAEISGNHPEFKELSTESNCWTKDDCGFPLRECLVIVFYEYPKYRYKADFDADLFIALRKVGDSEQDSIKVAEMAKKGLLDKEFYRQIRHGIKNGTDDFKQAGSLSMQAQQGEVDKDFYLTIRKGPGSGQDTYDEALEALVSAKSGMLDKNCYLLNRSGPYFGSLSHQDAMTRCLGSKNSDASIADPLYKRLQAEPGDLPTKSEVSSAAAK